MHRIQSQKTSLKYDTVKYSLILLSLNVSLFITYYFINLYIFIYFDNLADASLSLLTGTFLCGYALSVCQYIFILCLSFSFALFKLCFYMILITLFLCTFRPTFSKYHLKISVSIIQLHDHKFLQVSFYYFFFVHQLYTLALVPLALFSLFARDKLMRLWYSFHINNYICLQYFPYFHVFCAHQLNTLALVPFALVSLFARDKLMRLWYSFHINYYFCLQYFPYFHTLCSPTEHTCSCTTCSFFSLCER